MHSNLDMVRAIATLYTTTQIMRELWVLNPCLSAKKSKSKDLDFFICAAGTTSFACNARNIISSKVRTSLPPRAAQMNDVALRANDVLRNEVGLRPMMLRFAQTELDR